MKRLQKSWRGSKTIMKMIMTVVGAICCCLISGCNDDDERDKAWDASIFYGRDKNFVVCELMYERTTNCELLHHC